MQESFKKKSRRIKKLDEKFINSLFRKKKKKSVKNNEESDSVHDSKSHGQDEEEVF